MKSVIEVIRNVRKKRRQEQTLCYSESVIKINEALKKYVEEGSNSMSTQVLITNGSKLDPEAIKEAEGYGYKIMEDGKMVLIKIKIV